MIKACGSGARLLGPASRFSNPPHSSVSFDHYVAQELAEAQKGGVCEGRKQRRGNQPLLCRKVDLEEVVFSVRLLLGFGVTIGQRHPPQLT